MKMKVLMFGNCQIMKLRDVLQKLLNQDHYTIRHFKEVQEISSPDYFAHNERFISEADILITQNISNHNDDPFIHILPKLKPKSRVIVFDSLFFAGYHPELFNTHEIPKFTLGKLHDINVLGAYIEGAKTDEFLSNDPFNDQNLFPKEFFKKLHLISFSELLERQTKLFKKKEIFEFMNPSISITHISINNLIKNLFKFECEIWGDFNHPRNEVYKYLTSKLLEELNIQFDEEKFDANFNRKLRDGILKFPLYLTAINHHSFNKSKTSRTYDLGNSYLNKTREEYVQDIFKHYASCEKNKLISVFLDACRYKALQYGTDYQQISLGLINAAIKFKPNSPFLLNKKEKYIKELTSMVET